MTRLTLRSAAAAAAFLILATSPAWAQQATQPRGGPPGSWRLIGSVQANHNADHDNIHVLGPYDNFRRIKFKVTGAPLNMQHMAVTYDNGTAQKIDVRQQIPEGGESRVIDLNGGTRKIRTIEFWYSTQGLLKGKANVTVFGLK